MWERGQFYQYSHGPVGIEVQTVRLGSLGQSFLWIFWSHREQVCGPLIKVVTMSPTQVSHAGFFLLPCDVNGSKNTYSVAIIWHQYCNDTASRIRKLLIGWSCHTDLKQRVDVSVCKYIWKQVTVSYDLIHNLWMFHTCFLHGPYPVVLQPWFQKKIGHCVKLK